MSGELLPDAEAAVAATATADALTSTAIEMSVALRIASTSRPRVEYWRIRPEAIGGRVRTDSDTGAGNYALERARVCDFQPVRSGRLRSRIFRRRIRAAISGHPRRDPAIRAHSGA